MLLVSSQIPTLQLCARTEVTSQIPSKGSKGFPVCLFATKGVVNMPYWMQMLNLCKTVSQTGLHLVCFFCFRTPILQPVDSSLVLSQVANLHECTGVSEKVPNADSVSACVYLAMANGRSMSDIYKACLQGVPGAHAAGDFVCSGQSAFSCSSPCSPLLLCPGSSGGFMF